SLSCRMASSRSRAGSALVLTAGSTWRRASAPPEKAITRSSCSTVMEGCGHIVVASEYPFGASDALTSVREYDPTTGQLLRVFVPDRSLKFRRPRGLR